MLRLLNGALLPTETPSNGAIYTEATARDVAAYAKRGALGPLKGDALRVFIAFGEQLIEQRTLAKSDLLALALFSEEFPRLKEAARGGDIEAHRAIREGLERLGLLDGDLIAPFEGPTPAKVLRFRPTARPRAARLLAGPPPSGDDAA